MKKFRNTLAIAVLMLVCETAGSLFGLGTQTAWAQSRADRERCAESVGIQTRHDGRNSWIKRRVSSKTYDAFLRCTDGLAVRHAEARPGRR